MGLRMQQQGVHDIWENALDSVGLNIIWKDEEWVSEGEGKTGSNGGEAGGETAIQGTRTKK